MASIEKPPDLEQLDRGVQRQFEQLWDALYDADGSVQQVANLEQRVSALCLWFDAYRYADSAQRCYLQARQLDPKEPRWPYHLGRLAEDKGEMDAALAYFSEAARLAPESTEPKVKLGDLAMRREDLDAAQSLYAVVIAAHPQNPGALFGLARISLLKGDAGDALKRLELLSTRQPDAVQVRYLLATAWRQLGDADRAAEELRLVPEDNLDQVPLDLESPWERELNAMDAGSRMLTRRGVQASRRGDFIKAAILLGRAVESDPEGPEKRINYALALREIGNLEAAEAQLSAALRLAQGNPSMDAKAHMEMGRLLMATGRPKAAQSHLQSALSVDPKSIPAHIELARLYHLGGRIEEALSHYAAVLQIDAGLAETRFWHAALLILAQRHDEALTALEQATELFPQDSRLRLLLARTLAASPSEALRDTSRAEQLLSQARGSRDAFFAETAAMVAAGAGRFDEAMRWQGKAIEALEGVNPRAALHRARRRAVLYQRGEPCRAPWEAREIPISAPIDRNETPKLQNAQQESKRP
jgi:tetratricopeptide (TPR) repeat protein